jgi:protein phosphatase 2C family protein 2/3
MEVWPRCSFFGLYDGHAGTGVSEYLRDNLHRFIIGDANFPWNPREAITRGFLTCENAILTKFEKAKDVSGSCAVVALFVGDTCFIANAGDSRAIMSGGSGKKIYGLTRDHKPDETEERQRILEAGGEVYHGKGSTANAVAPCRVHPGRLAVSRSLGDYPAKIPQHGGNPLAIISCPEIRAFRTDNTHDFILIASDGVFDKLSNKECVGTIW